MTLEGVVGTTYGPAVYRTCREKVAEYVAATGDDPDRWRSEAPPSMAGALLFAVAPRFLSDEAIRPHARSVIHGDQTFTWLRPIPVETDLEVVGEVTKLRGRGGMSLVRFEVSVADGGGEVLRSSSTFLMSGESPPAGASVEESEPEPEEGSNLGPPAAVAPPGVGDPLTPLRRAASRADLVRYAAASRDWNPIHWDHAAAVAAGLPGVVCHGLLQAAWVCQAVGRSAETPLHTVRIRFRAPLRPAVTAVVSGSRSGAGEFRVEAVSGEAVTVSSTVTVKGS